MKDIVKNMLEGIVNQTDYGFSDKFCSSVIERLNLLVQNSGEAKALVQEYFSNDSLFRSEEQKKALMARFQ